MLIFRVYGNPVIVPVSRCFQQDGKIFLSGAVFFISFRSRGFSPSFFPLASFQEVIIRSHLPQIRHRRFVIPAAISSNFSWRALMNGFDLQSFFARLRCRASRSLNQDARKYIIRISASVNHANVINE